MPIINPDAAGMKESLLRFELKLIAGINNDQIEAASIIPAAKAISLFSRLCLFYSLIKIPLLSQRLSQQMVLISLLLVPS